MWTQSLQELVPADIQDLVKSETEESLILEFKQQLPEGGDDHRREFLYDVAAMANAAGGFIVFGIAEKRDSQGKPTGIAHQITGVDANNVPAEVARLENMIRDGLTPRLTGITSRTVMNPEGVVLILSIPRSLNSPHMVSFKQVNKFYGRVSSGKYPMSVDEIRRAFSQGAEFSDTIRKWREGRLEKVMANCGPVDLQRSPTMLFHIIPASAFSQLSMVSTWLLSQKLTLEMHCPSVDFSGTGRYNGNGYLKWVDIGGRTKYGLHAGVSQRNSRVCNRRIFLGDEWGAQRKKRRVHSESREGAYQRIPKCLEALFRTSGHSASLCCLLAFRTCWSKHVGPSQQFPCAPYNARRHGRVI